MQIKNNYPKTIKAFWIVIRALLIIGCIVLISDRIQSQEIDFDAINWPSSISLMISIVFVSMIVNWSLEAYRWKLSLKLFEPITFLQSLHIVLAGLAMNWIFPFTSGDALARLIPMKDRFQTTGAMLLNRGIMLGLTLLLGIYGVYFYSSSVFSVEWSFVVGVLLLLVIVYFLRNRIDQFTTYFTQLDTPTGLKLVGISIIRYGVFVIQFFILLKIFLPDLADLAIIAGIGWIFMARSMLPTILGGIGVREASGILFFDGLVSDLNNVIIPIFLLWIINTVIPSLFGLVSVWKLKHHKYGLV